MRVTFLLLLLANLVFFAWATLIDVAPEPPVNDSIAHLPRLKLLSEVRARQPQPASSQMPAPAGAPAPTNGASPGNSGTSSAASGTSAASAAQSSSASGDPVGSSAPSPAPLATADRCVTIGPFSDTQRASEATDLLRERGFLPRPRDEESRQQPGYWVYIGDLPSQPAAMSAVRRLERNGVTDARIMPASDVAGRRVSVGLFSRRADAERRARAVGALGLDARIEQQHAAATAHWVDVNLDSSTQVLPAESLLALEEDGSRLEIAECPSGAQASAADARAGEAGSASEKPGTAPSVRTGTQTAAPTPASRPPLSKPLAAQGMPQSG